MRGGGDAPGNPAHHRFWSDAQPTTPIDLYKTKIRKTMKLLGIKCLYNPPGDGMCFWSALTNGIQPGHTTHTKRLERALEAQRTVIRYLKDPTLSPDLLNKHMEIFRKGLDHGMPPTTEEYHRQLDLITTHPQLYNLPINDVLRAAAPEALACQIEWWSVYKPLDANFNIHTEAIGEGTPVRLLFDASGAHYMHIADTHPHSPCVPTPPQIGTEPYVPVDTENEDTDDTK